MTGVQTCALPISRGIVVYKGKRFKQGEYLPEGFTEKERWRTATPHCIVSVPESPVCNNVSLTETIQTPTTSTQIKASNAVKGNINAQVKSASPNPSIGTLSTKS